MNDRDEMRRVAIESGWLSPWQPMATAPRDGTAILVRRHNDVCFEHFVVRWTPDPEYAWYDDFNAYPEERLDEWMPIPE